MFKYFFIPLFLFAVIPAGAATRQIQVTGSGNERTYCNANSGSFCLNNIKNRAKDNAYRDAQWNCEMNRRGRSLTYTMSQSTYCNPSYLPHDHDGVWVSCRSDARMQCEVNN